LARTARTQAERDGASNRNAVVNGRGLNGGPDDDVPGYGDWNTSLEDGEGGDSEEGADASSYDPDYVPEGFETAAEFLSYAQELFTRDYNADEDNLLEAAEDLRFTYVDQWDPVTRAEREEAGRPCITVNTMNSFVAQVIGDRRINKTSIKVIPDRDGTVQVADTRSGLIKSIEYNSRAARVYDAACEDQVVCGQGNFFIEMEETKNDVLHYDLAIKQIANPLGVIWDCMSIDPTGRDAKHCFVIDEMPRTEFERIWPDVPAPDSFGTIDGDLITGDLSWWTDKDTVKVVGFWEMIEKPATFAMLNNGKVIDITHQAPADLTIMDIATDPNGEPFIRESVRTYAVWHLMTNFAILDGPYELPLTRLPVIRVSGRVGRVGTKQVRFGLVRWARDPSLLRNYWRSTAAETLAMAPRNQWIAPASAVKGREEDFRQAHLSGDPLLVFNDVAPHLFPQRMDPPNLPAAVLQQSDMNAQDIKDVTGLHDASLGIRSNEVSGKAIMARQQEGDVATFTYHDNLNSAIQEAGDVLNQLIPLCYDTARTVRVMGVDDEFELKRINDPDDDQAIDICSGKYDVSVITGPSFTTKRMEAAEMLLEMAKVNPQLFELAGDIIMETQDIPGGEKLAERLRKVLPAAQQEKKPEDMTPEEQAQAQQVMQQQQQQAELQMRAATAEIELKEAQAMKAKADALKAKVEAERLAAGESETGAEPVDPIVQEAQQREAQAKADLAAIQVDIARENARKAKADADAAEKAAQTANDNVHFNRAERTLKVDTLANPPKPAASASPRPAQKKRAAK
jgi:hypothetical protein